MGPGSWHGGRWRGARRRGVRLMLVVGMAVGAAACGSSRDDDDEEEAVTEYTVEGVVLGGTSGGEAEALSGYTVCVDLDRSWTCDTADETAETGGDGTFELEVGYEGDITAYPVIAEPGTNPAAVGARSGMVAVPASSERYDLSSWLDGEPGDLETVVVSPFTTLIEEQRQVTDRSVEHLERRLAAALGVPGEDLVVDYTDGGAVTGGRDLAGGLDTVLRRLQAAASVSDARWTENPGAVRNLIADRAFHYAGVIAEGDVRGALEDGHLDGIGFERGVYDLDLAGATRERLQQLDEEADTRVERAYPDEPYVLRVGREGSSAQLQWQRLDFAYDNGDPEAYSPGGEGVPWNAGAAAVLGLSPGGERELPRRDAERGVTCELDDPLRVRLSYAADAPWPVHHLVGGDRWRLAALDGAPDLGGEQTFGLSPARYLYRGGLSCEADGPGAVDSGFADQHLEAGASGAVGLADGVDAEGWGDWLPELEAIGQPSEEADAWGLQVETWDILTKEEEAPEFRGLVDLGGDLEGVYRYETFSEDDERFLYIDATPSGYPYGFVLRLTGGEIVAREYLLHGTSNEDLWLLDRRAASDLAQELD